MTDEELSELAECLEDACQKHIANGGKIGYYPYYCPVGAMLRARTPGWSNAAEALGVPVNIISGFMAGFDGDNKGGYGFNDDPRAFDLGRQFSERYT